MPKATKVYESFKSHKDRQAEILASVEKEIKETRRELEAASEALPNVIAEQFPTLQDLPLATFTTASRLRDIGIERDYDHMVSSLKAEAKRNREDYVKLTKAHGAPDEITDKLAEFNKEAAALTKRANKAKTDEEGFQRLAEENEANRLPLTRHAAEYGIQITNSDLPRYSKFNLSKWIFEPEYRDGRRAVKAYHKNGGHSITDDLAAYNEQKTKAEAFAHEAEQAHQAHAATLGSIQTLSGAKNELALLDKNYMDDAKIHKAVVASAAEMLRHEEVAKFLSTELPKEKADPLMVASLAFRNLGIINDNLEALQGNAQKTLDQISTPTSKLKKLVSRQPSKNVDIDLDKVDAQLGDFNKTVEDYVQKTSQSRKVLAKFSSSYQRPTNPAVINHYHDDSFSLSNFMLWQMMMSETTSSAAHNAPNVCIPTTTADQFSSAACDISLPSTHTPSGFDNIDTSSLNLPSFDTSSLSVPSIDLGSSTPSLDFGSSGSSSFDSSSSYSSYDSGGGGGSSYDSGSSSYSSYDSGSSSFDSGSSSSFITMQDRPRMFARHRRLRTARFVA